MNQMEVSFSATLDNENFARTTVGAFLTPLNPTAHKLVHSGVLPVHPKIIIGDWKGFFTEYQAFLNESAIKKYTDALNLEEEKQNVEIPQIMNYKPSKIVSPIQLPTIEDIQKLVVDSRMAKLEDMTGGAS